jgi:ribose-phosphate pyrophosphokinase
MEHLLMVDALKRASAKRITVVMPFYGYARQDKKHRGREPISARLMADMFKTAGADRLICVDLHTDQIQGFFDGPVDHLMAIPILSEYVATKYGGQDLAVVSPDAGRIKVAEQWSKRLGGVPLAFIHKTRDINRPNEMTANRVVGLVRDRVCVLVDDMIDTGGTITKAADALMADGAKAVVIAATHAILSDPAVQLLRDCAAEEVIVTNTLPIPPEKEINGITVLSIAPLISAAVKEVFEDGSVTSLFGGRA